MIKDIYLNPQSEKDLSIIYEYTFITFGLNQAELYQDQLFEGMKMIQDYEEIGEAFEFKTFMYRKLKISKHLLFYRVDKDRIVIIRVLHERMNFDSSFWKDDS